MKKNDEQNLGIQMLINKYKKIFRTTENVDYYSKDDYKVAEKKYIKYSLTERMC